MSNLSKVGNSSVDLIEAQKAMAREGKKHVNPILLLEYATNKHELSKQRVSEIETHVFAENCERCKEQLEIAQRGLNL